MFVDASVAILGREPGCREFEKRPAAVDAGSSFLPLAKFEASVDLARQKAAAKGTNVKPSPELLRRA